MTRAHERPTKPAIRIPFSVSVECGFSAVCFARDISRTGIQLEAPRDERSEKVRPGMKITLLISPFGSLPSVVINGKVARVAEIPLLDGKPGFEIGVEFETLPETTAGTLDRCIQEYLERSRAQNTVSAAQAAEENLETPAGQAFVRKLDPRSLGRLKLAMGGRKENLLDWAVGVSLMTELNLRAGMEAAEQSDRVERQFIHGRLATELQVVAGELESIVSGLPISDHVTRKEILTALVRLRTVWDELNPVQHAEAAPPTRKETKGPTDSFSVQFLSAVAYAEYEKTKSFSSVLSSEAEGDLAWLLEYWTKQVRPHPDLPTEAQELLERAQAYTLKAGFEARQIFRLRPITRDLALIQPGYRFLAGEVLKIGEELRNRFEAAPRGEVRDRLACLDRARSHLAATLGEFSTFLSSLPQTLGRARRFYDHPFFFRPEFEDEKETPKKKVQLKIGKGALLGGLLAISLIGALVYEWDSLSGWMIYLTSDRELGRELGVIPMGVQDNVWVGQVDPAAWDQIPPEVRMQQGNEMLRKIIDKGFKGLRIEGNGGEALGLTVTRNRKAEWLIVETEGDRRRAQPPASSQP
ncbi:MAG: PilZ domain-containing protein [Pseudomonadota bacterium]